MMNASCPMRLAVAAILLPSIVIGFVVRPERTELALSSRRSSRSQFGSFVEIGSHNDNPRPTAALFLAKGRTNNFDERWLPNYVIRGENSSQDKLDSEASEELISDLERRSIRYASDLIRMRLEMPLEREEGDNDSGERTGITNTIDAMELVRGRFIDLTCALEGERSAENLFTANLERQSDDNTIRGAVVVIQSLLVMGTQVGIKGGPDQQQRAVSHLRRGIDGNKKMSPRDSWDRNCVRKLKLDVDTIAATQLLAELGWKRTAQGAFDLLVALEIFGKYEDLALLRSGFPTRFTDEEEEAAREAELLAKDPDELLEIRKDFRSMKVYTIDGEGTGDIDDGLSVEEIEHEDGTKGKRIWIHIADADRWAPRDSKLFEIARRRATSLYLPTGSVPMFPKSIGNGIMSLRQGKDCCALSLGVELRPDGSIDPESVIMTSSLVNVQYRLTYDEVDEMFEWGIGFSEEWELGAMLDAASRRRTFRASNGSSEGRVRFPIPQASLKVVDDEDSEDSLAISVNVEVTHNAGANHTSIAEGAASSVDAHAAPASQAFLLVTEMMILGGEAIGKWRTKQLMKKSEDSKIRNDVDLPFRTQIDPDFRSRAAEVRVLLGLEESNNGYSHAWYFRRFFKPVRVTKEYSGHFGLGLDCYVQWTSPIRRFGDLQAHASVKRYLRRERVNDLLRDGLSVPSIISPLDLGCDLSDASKIFDDIDYKDGLALAGAARVVQRNSQEFWMFEYIRRMLAKADGEVSFECIVLGCVDPNRLQYAIYAKEIGLEHRYLSERGSLNVGETIWLKVASVNPRNGLLSLSLASKASGVASQSARAA